MRRALERLWEEIVEPVLGLVMYGIAYVVFAAIPVLVIWLVFYIVSYMWRSCGAWWDWFVGHVVGH